MSYCITFSSFRANSWFSWFKKKIRLLTILRLRCIKLRHQTLFLRLDKRQAGHVEYAEEDKEIYFFFLISIGILFFRCVPWLSNFEFLIVNVRFLPEMESVLKQFNLYVEDGVIDHDLHQISSDHLLFKNCKSLIQKKYVYPDSQEIECKLFL